MPAPSLLPQQLVAFLEVVWSARTEAAVALMAVERAAEALDAEIAAIVCENRVIAAVGYPEGAVPVRELVLIAEDGAHHELAVPGAGVCPADTVLLDYPLVGTFILARSEPGGGLRHDEASLLRGMARVTSMAMRTQRLLDDERAAREDSDRQAAENAQLLAELTQRQARLTELAGEQAALRRVATLVAASWGFGDQADADRIFAAVAEEAGRLLRADVGAVAKFGPAGCFTVLAVWSKPGMDFHFPVGEQLPIEEGSLSARVLRSGRPSRLDTYDATAGRLVQIRDRFGLRSMIGAPIMVGGRVWGLVTVGVISSRSEALPAGSEQRLADFTELLATAISNAQARSELARLAEEQAALRRVATLVATGTAAEDLFEAVTIEMRMLLNAGVTSLQRYEADGTVTVLAASSDPDTEVPLLSHLTLGGRSVAAAVLSSGRAARIDELEGPPGSQPGIFRGLGMRSSAGAPIVVEGRLWGVIIAYWRDSQAATPDTEGRIAQFTQLVATAISNAASRAQLAASRARIVVTADETRRRIERNLHDGIQQRLVTLALRLRTAQDADADPAEHAALLAAMSQAGDELVSILDELREISRGVHPAILSQGGLGPALRSLTRRASVPTVLDIDEIGRLPQPVEVASYYVVSEALTNAAKHADATVVQVNLGVTDTTLRLSIDDDGDGGADPARGSGIIGLIDRVEALGGKLTLRSPPGEGTSLVIELPLEPSSRSGPAQDAPGRGDQGAGDLLRGQ